MGPNENGSVSTANKAPVTGVGGVLLTGGSSRRLGIDKMMLVVDGEQLARKVARLLGEVVAPAIEVGPGRTNLRSVSEPERGAGPLVALVCGWELLLTLGHDGPVIALAADLPHVTADLLRFLAEWPGGSSAVPVVGGRVQPLCARWSRPALDHAHELVAAGQRSMRALVATTQVDRIGPEEWGQVATAKCFTDLDSPEDLTRLVDEGRVDGGTME